MDTVMVNTAVEQAVKEANAYTMQWSKRVSQERRMQETSS